MVKPSQFILTTDDATLKNDASNSLSFTIPASIAIPPTGVQAYLQSNPLTIGSTGAITRTSINSSASPTQWFTGPALQIEASGNDSVAGAVVYSYFITVTRTSATTLSINTTIPNQGFGGTLTTEPTVRTITVKVNTFLPPFTS